MTLLAEIQQVLERTYSTVGINLEECVVGTQRFRQLSRLANASSDLSLSARTFIRTSGENLFIAIYYSPELVRCLEQEHPRYGLSDRNIEALIAFVEEITHGVHAALAFQRGKLEVESELFCCQLEMQAKIDTYWLLIRFLYFLCEGKLFQKGKYWIFHTLFERENFDYIDRKLAHRYRLANHMASSFIRKVSPLTGKERINRLRVFREMNFREQYRYCFYR
ncbi:MAG: hypothetical protein R3F23_00565 [Verrucomicrobiia bacterium]